MPLAGERAPSHERLKFLSAGLSLTPALSRLCLGCLSRPPEVPPWGVRGVARPTRGPGGPEQAGMAVWPPGGACPSPPGSSS